jgi:S-adenosylmethionine hydrolase
LKVRIYDTYGDYDDKIIDIDKYEDIADACLISNTKKMSQTKERKRMLLKNQLSQLKSKGKVDLYDKFGNVIETNTYSKIQGFKITVEEK